MLLSAVVKYGVEVFPQPYKRFYRNTDRNDDNITKEIEFNR